MEVFCWFRLGFVIVGMQQMKPQVHSSIDTTGANSTKMFALLNQGTRAAIAGVVEIHEMAMEKDVMKMRQIKGLDIAPGKVTELKPGGYHVMLMDFATQMFSGAWNANYRFTDI